jgi:hypothetical protein
MRSPLVASDRTWSTEYACKCFPRMRRYGPSRNLGSYRCSVSSLGSAQISSDQSYGATDERGQLGTRLRGAACDAPRLVSKAAHCRFQKQLHRSCLQLIADRERGSAAATTLPG